MGDLMPDRAKAPAAWAIACTVSTIVAACSGDAGRPPSAVFADSAGVRVVTYDLTGLAIPTYKVVAEHDLQVGVPNGAPEYTFSSIPDLAVAPDGSLVVSDALAQELRVYDTHGQFLGRIGHAGEGPGEFATAPMIVGFEGDTVFALDNRSSRLTAFTMDGGLLTMATLGMEASGRPEFIIRQADGTLLSQSPWVNPTPDHTVHDMRLELDSIVIERLESTGAPIDTVLVIADRTRARHTIDAGGGLFRTRQAVPPFVARAFMRSDGRRSITARSDSFELHIRGPQGKLQTALHVLGVQNPMTGDELRRRQDAALREAFGDDIDPLLRRLNVEFIPDRLQAFQNIVVAADGDIWVALTEFDASRGYDWLVFDSNAILRGSVGTPPKFTLFEVHDDFVIGIFQDEFDVSYVRRYPLISD